MQLFAPALAIVDLETTGMHAEADRITEVGIIRVDVDPAGGPPRLREWSTLVNPGLPIPSAIQALTGITDAMVANAPPFAAIATRITEELTGATFIAHNARFDHGFLKHAFARAQLPFSVRALCTVRLSRRLFPDAVGGHGLDAIVARHGLPGENRHRALGDARAVWQFIEALYRDLPAATIEAAVKRLLRTPSLPPQLAPDVLTTLPERPGVYLFYGDNPLPLYIGKSVNLRERVAAHFSSDWQRETDLRLSQEIRRIEYIETAGELGALMREAALVKQLLPAHNRTLRRKDDAGVLKLDADGLPQFVAANAIDPGELGGKISGSFGPFGSRRSAKEALRSLAIEHALCWRRLGLERAAPGPCFQRQLRRCGGACDGTESTAAHDARLHAALARLAIAPWPLPGPGLVRESGANNARNEVHLLRDWCWLGTARDDGELGALLAAPPRARFDLDIARLLLRRHGSGTLALLPAPSMVD